MAEDYTQRATCECYYKFENNGDLGEDNQNQVDLTNNGAVQSATIPSGTYANPSAQKSADFEHDDSDYMEALHNDAQDVDDMTNITLLCWFRLESTDEATSALALMTVGADGWRWKLNNNNSKSLVFGAVDYSPGWVFSTGTWYFIAATYDGDWIRHYDGEEEAQVTEFASSQRGGPTTASTAGNFRLGDHPTAANEHFDGLICEFAVFSEALSLSDLEDIQQYGMEGVTFIPKVIMIT